MASLPALKGGKGAVHWCESIRGVRTVVKDDSLVRHLQSVIELETGAAR